ncbi:methylmalonyl-CoA mutase [Candidatus Bathyarchaeota archaeon]|nr:MAG: methylmalonyl-CoA mutase [Candidatus Bathyarchaeota archaeon]
MFDEKFLEKLREKEQEWLETKVKKALTKVPERKKEFKTFSGIPLKRIYTPEDIKDIDYFEDIAFPGEFPYTRGIYPLMYRSRLYTIRQYTGWGTAEETNKRWKYLLAHGETGLSAAFDLPTQLGYDPDHPMAKGEVGKVGCSMSNIAEYELLYKDISMDQISVHLQVNATAPFIVAMHIAEGDRRGVPRERLWGACQNEVLKEFVARGTFIFPVEPSMKLACDLMEFCVKNMPRWQPITVCQYHIQEAGADFVTAMGLSFANAIAYVEAMLNRGLPIDSFAFNISVWNCVCGPDFFESICGLRAARRLWAKIMKERFGAKDPRSCMMRIFIGSGGIYMTRVEPLNNIVRAALSSVAAALAGVQAQNIQCYDEAYAIPTEESMRLALRTMQIVAYESGITDVIDPLGGSYFIEALTKEIEKRIMEIIQMVDDEGGAVEAIRKGWMQRLIAKQAYEQQKKIESGEIVRVGENLFAVEKEAKLENVFRVSPEVEERVIERLNKFRASRDTKKVEEALAKLQKAAEKGENTMPYIIDAVKARATLGEMCDTLVQVYGRAEEMAIW